MTKKLLETNSQLLKALVDYKLEASVLLLGSTSSLSGMPYNSRLSDVDLLCVPSLESFEDYVGYFEKIITLTQYLNRNDTDIVDVFSLSADTANLHFSYLSVLAGAHEVDLKKAILGVSTSIRVNGSPKKILRKHVYIVKAFDSLSLTQKQLPVADTSHARKVTKELLRTLKVTICALHQGGQRHLEDKLIHSNNFLDLEPFVSKFLGTKIPHLKMLQNVLKGEDIQDWPAWMIAQEEIAQWLNELECLVVEKLPGVNRRLCGGIVQVRDMLLLDLKDIFRQKNDKIRAKMIHNYADSVAGVIVRLSMAGVPHLGDLTSGNVPARARAAYEVMVKHLADPRPNLGCLAAAVILLEFSLEQTVGLE